MLPLLLIYVAVIIITAITASPPSASQTELLLKTKDGDQFSITEMQLDVKCNILFVCKGVSVGQRNCTWSIAGKKKGSLPNCRLDKMLGLHLYE